MDDISREFTVFLVRLLAVITVIAAVCWAVRGGLWLLSNF